MRAAARTLLMENEISSKGGVRMGPAGIPWMTFLAVVVTAGSIVFAILWAVEDRRRDEEQGKS